MTKRDAEKDVTPAVVADRMVDAVTYLSRVADEAGLSLIATKLRSVRRSLRRRATQGDATGGAARRPEQDAPRQTRDH